MRIAVVTPWYPNPGHATEGIFVRNEVAALAEAGADIFVVYLNRQIPAGEVRAENFSGRAPGADAAELVAEGGMAAEVDPIDTALETKVDGIEVIQVGMNPTQPWSVGRAAGPLSEILGEADVIHSHAISVLPIMGLAGVGRSGSRMRRGRGLRDKLWVHSEHWSALANPQTASPLLRAVRPAFATLLRLPDVVVAESERLARAVRKFRGRRETAIVPCIVPAPKRLTARRRHIGDTFKLVSTGGLIDRKNPKLCIETLAELRKMGYQASLRWCGVGPQMEECRELAARLRVKAEFLGTCLPAQVQAEIGAADFFIAPTKGDNFFVAAAEVLVGGRPLCASPYGGHVEYAPPQYSEIVAVQTPRAYAEALIRLRDKTQGVRAKQISDAVRDRFAPATIAEQLLSIYREGRPAPRDRSAGH